MATIRPRRSAPRAAATLAAATLLLVLWAPASARADWTTYRGDAGRSGVDSSSVGSLPFASTWTSPNLGGSIYGEPLIHGGLVIVGTESNQVVALNEATGQVAWQASAGTPVPSSRLSCGNISPNVGITSTPVIDPATNRVFVVADTLQNGNIQHELYAYDVASGALVSGFPGSVEPPNDTPKDQLQRTALALAGGQVVVGYGGNDGDCGSYHGWLVSVPESGGSLRTFEVDPNGSEGAIWGSGNGPAVDSAGNLWVSTGNGGSGTAYGYQESVLRLDPNMDLLDSWAPLGWQQLDSSDTDLGSSAPVLLPNGLVFQIGKAGVGYLLSAGHLGGTNAPPLYQLQVCSGSWGGAVYSGGIIYVSCSNGLRALALNTSAQNFSPVGAWQVNSAINGPPIVAGGLVWATDWNNGKMYGLNPQTGQAAVTQSTPSMEHFTSPSASDGKLFLATGQTVEAYTIANPAPTASTPPPPPPVAAPAKCVLRLHSTRITMHHPKPRKHYKHALPAYATVSLVAKCDQAVQVTLTGIVSERLPKQSKHGKAKIRRFRLAATRATLKAGVARTVEIRLTPRVLNGLLHRIRESGSFTLSTTNAGGTTRVGAHNRLRL